MSEEIVALGQWEKAKQAIAECKNIDEVKKIRDKAEALRAYAKQAKESLEVQNNVAEIKIRCERRIGEFSKELPKENANQYKSANSHDGKKQLLKDAGIQHYERYEAIANLPEEAFNKHIEEVKKSNEELTTIGVIKLAREMDKDERMKKENTERKRKVEGIEIRKGDFAEALKDVYDIDAIITDPPYPLEFIECFSRLSLFAKEHLKKDGFIAVYSGQYHLPEVIKRLSEHLSYVWTFCLYHSGKNQLVNGVNIMCGWKPVLIFSNGRKKMRFSAYDVLISEEREKHSHKWQQSESGVFSLIETLSKPKDLIVDPFAGSGTFLKVAHENGRRAIGAEIEK
ncbi:MAG: DNA methyltransferase [Gallionella sp.]|jgi:16S rRNA G966 N2-methylase RsmD